MNDEQIWIPPGCPKQVLDFSGKTMMQLAFFASFYFRGNYEKKWIKQVGRCMEDYIHAEQEHLKWAKHPRTHKMGVYPRAGCPSPLEFLSSLEPGSSFEMLYHGGATMESASEHLISVVVISEAIQRGDSRCSYLHFKIPIQQFSQNREREIERTMRYWNELEAFFGYAGIGIFPSYDYAFGQDYHWLCEEVSHQFIGLEFEHPTYTSLLLEKGGIRGINWLTFLQKSWVEELGGMSYLRQELGPEFPIKSVKNGVMIQAGPVPVIGKEDPNLVYYLKLNEVLKPIRVKKQPWVEQELIERFDQVKVPWVGEQKDLFAMNLVR